MCVNTFVDIQKEIELSDSDTKPKIKSIKKKNSVKDTIKETKSKLSNIDCDNKFNTKSIKQIKNKPINLVNSSVKSNNAKSVGESIKTRSKNKLSNKMKSSSTDSDDKNIPVKPTKISKKKQTKESDTESIGSCYKAPPKPPVYVPGKGFVVLPSPPCSVDNDAESLSSIEKPKKVPKKIAKK